MRYRVFPTIILAFALLFPDSRFAAAQSIHPVDLDGTIVNFVVPAGYCVLDRSNPHHRTILDHYYPNDGAEIRVLVFFVECYGLAAFRSIDETPDDISDNGVYFTKLNPNGTIKTFPGMNRGEFVEMFAKIFPKVPLDALRAELNKALRETADSVTSFEVSQAGLTDYDSNALYVSMIVGADVAGERRIVGGSTAVTFVYEKHVFLGLARLMESENSLVKLDSDVRRVMAAFLAANPDSDN